MTPNPTPNPIAATLISAFFLSTGREVTAVFFVKDRRIAAALRYADSETNPPTEEEREEAANTTHRLFEAHANARINRREIHPNAQVEDVEDYLNGRTPKREEK